MIIETAGENKIECEFLLTDGMIRNRIVDDGCVFCMKAWRCVDPDKYCTKCANNRMKEGRYETDAT